MSFNEELNEYKLSEITEMKYGKYIPKKELIDEGYSYFNGYGIVGYLPNYKYENKQLVIVARGVGGTGDIKMSPTKCTIANLSIVIKPNEEIVKKGFLYWKLKSCNIDKLITGSAQSQIVIKDLKPFKIRIPKILEQEKIVNILSSLDQKIEINNQMNQTLEKIAKAIYKNWFIDFEPFQDEDFIESELGMIPEGWEVKKIKDISKVVLGKTPSTRNEDNYSDKYPFIRLPDMNGKTFVYKTEKYLSEKGHQTQENKLIPEDSILVSCIGTIGEVVINSKPSHTNQQINTIVCNDYLREFLFIKAKRMKKKLIKIGSGGTTMGNVNKTTFQNLKIIFPSEEVIKDFHKVVSTLFDKIKLNNFENNNLKLTRDALIPKLMSGEIRVESFEKERG